MDAETLERTRAAIKDAKYFVGVMWQRKRPEPNFDVLDEMNDHLEELLHDCDTLEEGAPT